MASLNLQLFRNKEIQIINDLLIYITDVKSSIPQKISLDDELSVRIKKYNPIALVPLEPPLITCTDSYVIQSKCS
jgi:hypothetical protein